MTAILKIGLVTRDDHGRLLVVRKHGGITFILPGGKPEGTSESDMACLERELTEELGVQPTGALDLMGTFESSAVDQPGDVVQLRAWRGQIHGEPKAQAEIAEMRWVDPADPGVPVAPSITEHLLPLLESESVNVYRSDDHRDPGGQRA